ncbi:MAG TPA: energy transducer TonB [Candidatus Acidoferrum sp.]|nr:energy transducer TonB [Candidatus Acidoferrum sp.]
MLPKSRSFLFFFAWWLLPLIALGGAKKPEISPEALIGRARSQEILWQKGTPPTVMRADLQLSDGKGGWVRGEYRFYWMSLSQWREEIRFGDYYRVRTGGEKGYWQTSNLEYQPEVIFDVDKLVSLKKALRIGGQETLSKVQTRRMGGASEHCAEVRGRSRRDSTLCFDGSGGELLTIDYPVTEPGNPSEISRVEYSSFKPVETRSIPFEIQGFHGRRPALVITITKIEAMPEHDLGLFQPPPKSEFWASCDEVTDPDLTHVVFPDAPRPVEFAKSVTLYLVVEADGSPSHITVIEGQDPGVEAAAVAAARQWRYKPATCGNSPVRKEVETTLTVRP